jgi:hypothetical protein
MRRGAYSLRMLMLVTLGVLVGMLALSASALAAAPEEPKTEAPNPIAGTTATFKGELNPGASVEKVAYHFDYTAGAASACTESGLTAPAEPFPEKEGNHVKVTQTVTGLEGSTEYAVCLIATSIGAEPESTTGSTEVFKTLASAPTAENENATSNSPFTETIEAQVNAENQATTSCVFEYGLNNTYGKTATCEPEEFAGAGPETATAHLSGLKSKTIYHYRIVVKNATGTIKAADAEFTTAIQEPPTTEGESATELATNAATLGATINPNYQETAYSFEYSTEKSKVEKGEGTKIAGESELPAEYAGLPVSVKAEALQERTTYFYRVVATNEAGTTDGTVEEFTTLATPVVTPGEVEDITPTTARITATVNPSGAATTYRIEYVDQAGYEQAIKEGDPSPYALGTSTLSGSAGAGYLPVVIGPVELSELTPATTYHYAVVTTNSVGETVGSDHTFETGAPIPPLVETGPASAVTELSATIEGAVDTRGLPTIVAFELRTSPSETPSSAPATVSESEGTFEVVTNTFLGDLQAGTKYEYRVVATNRDGESEGAWESFTTAAFPPPTPFLTPQTFELLTPPAVVETPKPPKPTPPPTRAQKLAKALKACQKKPKKQRASCKRQAEKKYGPVKKKK